MLSSNLAENGVRLAQGGRVIPKTAPESARGGEALTALLDRWAGGDPRAFDALMPLVYRKLHDLAAHYLHQERRNHTLQPTALVHEAYMRLAGVRRMHLRNRSHFYGAAAQVMRRVLVDYARERCALKRGGPDLSRVPFDDASNVAADDRLSLLSLDEALTELERLAPDRARVVELRYFGGLSIQETADYMGISPATVKRYWEYSRAWLFRRLDGA